MQVNQDSVQSLFDLKANVYHVDATPLTREFAFDMPEGAEILGVGYEPPCFEMRRAEGYKIYTCEDPKAPKVKRTFIAVVVPNSFSVSSRVTRKHLGMVCTGQRDVVLMELLQTPPVPGPKKTRQRKQRALSASKS